MGTIKIDLAVIPEPAEGTPSVLMSVGPAGMPLFIGQGPVDFACGACGSILMAGLDLGQVTNTVLACKNCGAYNEAGLFQTARGGLHYLIDRNVTLAQLQELLAVLRQAK